MQLERLRRHYEMALQTYDAVALLDLSHLLRIWADLRSQLPGTLPKSSSTMLFRNASPARKLKQTIGPRPFVLALLPGGIRMRGLFGLGGAPAVLGGGNWHVGANVKPNADAYGQIETTEVSHILIVRDIDAPGQLKSGGESIARVNFPRWLDGECVRMRRSSTDPDVVRITTEQMIRRVANTLDGSHPIGMPTTMSQPVDADIEYLLQVNLGGFPLPHTVLLKAAQDILTIFTPWVFPNPQDSASPPAP